LPEVIKAFIYSGARVEIPDVDDETKNQALTPPSDEEEPSEDTAEQAAPPETEPRPEPEVRTIIKEVYIEPPPLTREDIERMYRDDIAEICRQAEERAYNDARKAKEAEISRCIAEVEALLREIRLEQEQYMERYIRELKYFAVDIAEKLILQKISEDDMVLEKLVLKTVSESLGSQWLKVEVSNRLTKLVERLKEELNKPEYRGQAMVTPVEAPIDTCRVVTESGATVATVSVQAENLRRVFSEAENPES